MKKEVKIQIAVILSIMVIVGIIGHQSVMLEKEIEQQNQAQVTIIHKQPVDKPVDKVDNSPALFSELGEMGKAIEQASKEFGVPATLIVGIARAESNLGKHFFNPYDFKCSNWWGLKGGNMKNRKDGSSLRCFNDEVAGARTVAKTLKDHYLDEGRDTPSKICQKWIGAKFANKKQSNGYTHCENWVATVAKYHK